MLGGAFGRYLRIDLTRASSEVVPLDRRDLELYLGGSGLGALLLHRETRAKTDALAPSSAIVFAFGPLTATPLTTSAKLAVVAKSPLTERFNDALSSSSFALSAKRTGHDAIVITGKASAPSVIVIDDDRVELAPCEDVWGTGASIAEATSTLSERFPGFDLAVIGVAGEKLVRYAGIANDGRHAGRGGMGAVLGSKLVKAIAVRGSKRVPLFDVDRTLAIAKDLAARSMGPATEKYRALGTVANLAAFNRLSVLPTANFRASSFEGAEALGGETLHATRARGRGSCRSCTIGCEHFFEVAPGEAPVKAEYENMFALGPMVGVSDPRLVLAASRACDALGLDTISAGGTIAFAMEHAELGLFVGTKYEGDARGLGFGDGARVLELLDKIARREGALGDLLAEGSRRAAKTLGRGAEDRAPHVKGLELPGYDPRALQTMALGFAINARGADHNRSGAYEADFAGKTDRFAIDERTVEHAIASEERAAILDSLILCKFLRGALHDLEAEAAEMVRAVTGMEASAESMRAFAKRVVVTKHLFNLREGWTREEDTLPARLFEPRPDGARIDRARFESAVASAHRARGLRPDGTAPEETIDLAGIDQAMLRSRA